MLQYENFNDTEAMLIAIHLEEEGLEFYSTIAKNVKCDKVRETFSQLASDEKEHLAQFQKVHLDLSPLANPVGDYEDCMVDLYLKYLVDTGVFTKKGEAKRLANEINTDTDALKVGIQAEEAAIHYYCEAAKKTKHKKGKKVFKQLANEERRHLALLTKHLKESEKAV
ncbi:MAG: ferritin-like domain-containing protein [Candidatus Loosdrechtia sp.]|uniref:ferritin-like domain-containing protein n=1 Tax=Candidatus Loosdrechtia sp. TaxID=3101272 RepID=UPI003A5F21D4|nr:MAG: ferritin family protein [Candidatus Jettenia sp. AMX2]